MKKLKKSLKSIKMKTANVLSKNGHKSLKGGSGGGLTHDIIVWPM